MSNVHDKCPRCGGRWSRKDPIDGFRDCVTFCGMQVGADGYGVVGRLLLTLGPYLVYWYERTAFGFAHDDTCRIWYTNGPIVYRGDDLPYDIDDDMVKIILTFS